MTKTLTRRGHPPGFRLCAIFLVIAALLFVVFASVPARADAASGLSLEEVHDGLDRDGRTDFLTIIAGLSRAGYVIVSTDVTLLNRVRIRADNGLHLREIVVSRASGRVLRDVVVETYEAPATVPLEDQLEFLPDGTIRLRQDEN